MTRACILGNDCSWFGKLLQDYVKSLYQDKVNFTPIQCNLQVIANHRFSEVATQWYMLYGPAQQISHILKWLKKVAIISLSYS